MTENIERLHRVLIENGYSFDDNATTSDIVSRAADVLEKVMKDRWVGAGPNWMLVPPHNYSYVTPRGGARLVVLVELGEDGWWRWMVRFVGGVSIAGGASQNQRTAKALAESWLDENAKKVMTAILRK